MRFRVQGNRAFPDDRFRKINSFFFAQNQTSLIAFPNRVIWVLTPPNLKVGESICITHRTLKFSVGPPSSHPHFSDPTYLSLPLYPCPSDGDVAAPLALLPPPALTFYLFTAGFLLLILHLLPNTRIPEPIRKADKVTDFTPNLST